MGCTKENAPPPPPFAAAPDASGAFDSGAGDHGRADTSLPTDSGEDVTAPPPTTEDGFTPPPTSGDGPAAPDSSGDAPAPPGDAPAPPGDRDAVVDGSGGGDADFQMMIERYKSWRSSTSEPIAVSSYIFALCRAPTPFEEAFATSEHGNHRLIREWNNDLASLTVADGGTYPFAPGSAIVKEKLLHGDGGLAVVALGLMFKRKAGFDPAHGDWDFAYWEQGAGLRSGPTQSAHCGDCHAPARGTDFVFATSLAPGR